MELPKTNVISVPEKWWPTISLHAPGKSLLTAAEKQRERQDITKITS